MIHRHKFINQVFLQHGVRTQILVVPLKHEVLSFELFKIHGMSHNVHIGGGVSLDLGPDLIGDENIGLETSLFFKFHMYVLNNKKIFY